VQEYFPMGDFAAYIWSAWGIAGALLLAIWRTSDGLLRRQMALLATLEAEEKS
jgi:heme exporter protein D